MVKAVKKQKKYLEDLMKKIIGLLLGMFSAVALASCDVSALLGGLGKNSGSTLVSESVTAEKESNEEKTSEEASEHKHQLTRVAEKKASCAQAGNKTYYKCDCGEIFLDAMGTEKSSIEAVTIAKEEHSLIHTAEIEPTCASMASRWPSTRRQYSASRVARISVR